MTNSFVSIIRAHTRRPFAAMYREIGRTHVIENRQYAFTDTCIIMHYVILEEKKKKNRFCFFFPPLFVSHYIARISCDVRDRNENAYFKTYTTSKPVHNYYSTISVWVISRPNGFTTRSIARVFYTTVQNVLLCYYLCALVGL